jgi:hypothetical protein
MWLACSLIGNVLLLVILFNERLHITKAMPEDIDPIFKSGEMGPSKDTEILFINHGVSGGISYYETWIICNLAKKAETIFEFGTCTGRTTWLLATNAPQATITTLTPHPKDLESCRTSQGTDEKTGRNASAESRFNTFYYQGTDAEKRIIQLFGDSKELDEQPFARKFDLVFIDGSHERSYVESDSKKALAMVKPGGLVVWHDYRGLGRKKDVFHVLNRLAKKIALVHIEGTWLVAHRAPNPG